MANEITSKEIVGDQITLFVTHDTANPSADFTLLPALQNGAYKVLGFSCTDPPAGTFNIFSGGGGTASNRIWSYKMPGNQNLDFTGPFINTGFSQALNLRSDVAMGTFTLVAQIV